MSTPESQLRAVWRGMIRRCTNPKDTSYDRYGGRGIAVCDRWRESFAAFEFDMGHPRPGYSIDRIDVDGNYEPSNCRWATAQEQALNRHDHNRAKTKCPSGHPYDERNTYVSTSGARHCITCSRASTQAWRKRQRGGPAAPYGAAKTHCANGHEFTPENTGRKTTGARRCRACDREHAARKRLEHAS